MTITKKHYKDMAVRLGNLRFKYKDKSSSNTADLIMDYEDRINEFFNSFSDTYDVVLVKQMKSELKNMRKHWRR